MVAVTSLVVEPLYRQRTSELLWACLKGVIAFQVDLKFCIVGLPWRGENLSSKDENQ